MSLSHQTLPGSAPGLPRHDWTREEVRALFAMPFPDLMFRAAQVHRENFDSSEVQISTLLSIKTGGCPEDCAYCPQSAKFDTGVKAEKLMDLDAVLAEARLTASSIRTRGFAGQGAMPVVGGSICTSNCTPNFIGRHGSGPVCRVIRTRPAQRRRSGRPSKWRSGRTRRRGRGSRVLSRHDATWARPHLPQ